MEEFCKSFYICRRYDQKSSVLFVCFFDAQCRGHQQRIVHVDAGGPASRASLPRRLLHNTSRFITTVKTRPSQLSHHTQPNAADPLFYTPPLSHHLPATSPFVLTGQSGLWQLAQSMRALQTRLVESTTKPHDALCIFTARRYASAVYAVTMSLSRLCPSQVRVKPKRLSLGSYKQCHTITRV